MAAFPYPDKISQSSSSTLDQKALVSSYGDGYEQRAAVGINNIAQVWNVQLNFLTLSERNTLVAFYRAHGRVVSFDWTPPNESAGKWVFGDALSETNHGDRYSFSMVLRQVFET